MPEANDTVVTEPVATETEASLVNGTDVDESTASDTPVEQVEQDKDWKAEAERLAREQNKLQQELNLRRNKEKELERKALEETGQFKEAYEKLLAEREEEERVREQERLVQEAEAARDEVLKDYDEEVARVAKELNIWWDEAQDYEGAKESLRAKLDKIKAVRPTAPVEEEDDTVIHPNNPVLGPEKTELERLSKLTAAEMRELLPKADR